MITLLSSPFLPSPLLSSPLLPVSRLSPLLCTAHCYKTGLAKQKEKNSLAKDDLLDMIRFGADSAVHVSALPDGELDIDALLEASVQKVRKLLMLGRRKLKLLPVKTNEFQRSFSGRSTSFNLSTVTSYDKTKDVFYDQTSSKAPPSKREFYLEIGKRRREHVEGFYNEDESFRSKIRLAEVEKKPKVKPVKVPLKIPRNFSLPTFHEHQFLNISRLTELYELRISAWKLAHQLNHVNGSLASILKVRTGISDSISHLLGHQGQWTDELQLELDRLLAEGFPSWSIKDFSTFKRALYDYGRNDTLAIAGAMVNKSKDEVERYVAAFFSKGPEWLRSWGTTIRNVEMAEEEMLQRLRMIQVLALTCYCTMMGWERVVGEVYAQIYTFALPDLRCSYHFACPALCVRFFTALLHLHLLDTAPAPSLLSRLLTIHYQNQQHTSHLDMLIPITPPHDPSQSPFF
eukprot:762629-Hanusia_phi.AAC.4